MARWVPPAQRTIHLLGRSFDAAFAAALADKARAERTSVHGALAAAICLAVAADRGASGSITILFGSTVNLRPLVEPPAAEEVAFYVGFSEFRERIDVTGDFWELARRVRTELVRDQERLGPLTALRLLQMGMRLAGSGRRPAADVVDRFAQAARGRAASPTSGAWRSRRRTGPSRSRHCTSHRRRPASAICRSRRRRSPAGCSSTRCGRSRRSTSLRPGPSSTKWSRGWRRRCGARPPRVEQRHRPIERGPLVRAVWLRHEVELGTLILTFHHIIGDGMSGALLVRDLIGVAAGTRDLPFRALRSVRPLEGSLPKALRGRRGDWSFLRFLARSLWCAMTSGRPLQLRVSRWVPPSERRIHFLGRSFDAVFTNSLIEKARAEHTSVHGALAAAICMAVVSDRGISKPTTILFGSTVNLRDDRLEPPVGEEVGFYVGFSEFRGRIDATEDLWAVARRVRNELIRDNKQLGPFSMLRLLRLGMRLAGQGRRPACEVVNRFAQAVPATSGLSNVGHLAVEQNAGRLQLETLHFVSSPSGLGDLTFTATSFAGRLQFNAMWPDPSIDEPQARAIVDDVVARLEAAVRCSA